MNNASTLINPKASKNAIRLFDFLKSIYGKKILTGQHTKTIPQDELRHIQEVTGKLPAICGFELLGYSPNICRDNADESCLKEVDDNRDTIQKAIEWSERGGIVTYCWHWFSPTSGRDKSFYTQHTDFDLTVALKDGSEENKALLRDLDQIADHLKIFAEKDIPILWRPLHEADGKWFWWGAKGSEACKELWYLMYDRFVHHHKLHNLIWVWNSYNPDWYPGSDRVDLLSTDFYSPNHDGGCIKEAFDKVCALDSSKMIALAENGPVPDVANALANKAPWLWYMTWCEVFCTTEDWTFNKDLIKTYNDPNALTLQDLKNTF